jgi:alanyl-tRNA synthetase
LSGLSALLGNFSLGQYVNKGAIAYTTELIQERPLALGWRG